MAIHELFLKLIDLIVLFCLLIAGCQVILF